MARKFIRFLLTPAFVFMLIQSGKAAGISVEGQLTCATWASSRSQKTAGYFEHYLIGLVNGLSLGSGTEFWNAKGTSLTREQIFFWMDMHCQKDPLSDVLVGTITLMNENTGGEYTRRVSSQPN